MMGWRLLTWVDSLLLVVGLMAVLAWIIGQTSLDLELLYVRIGSWGYRIMRMAIIWRGCESGVKRLGIQHLETGNSLSNYR